MMVRPDDVIREIRRLAADAPDYVYESPSDEGCVYVDPETRKGSCIVGQALVNLDPTLSIELIEDQFVGADKWLERLEVCSRDSEPARWVRAVQELQDASEPWGKAIAIADGEEV